MFPASHHDRHDFDSAQEMAESNRRYFVELGTEEGEFACQLLDASQAIVIALNEALKRPSNQLLNPEFSSKAHVLLGNNLRSVSTFRFADGSRAISIDMNVLFELSVLIYAVSRRHDFGSWLAAWIFYHNIQSDKDAFPGVPSLFSICAHRSPTIFNDILRSCLYCLLLHEIGHEYIGQFGAGHALMSADTKDFKRGRKLCLSPPLGPEYLVGRGPDGRERIFVRSAEWIEEFAADQFAFQATMIMVSNGSTLSFSDFEKAIHHLALWQFVIFYLGTGNMFRHDQDRESHPSSHNRVDLMVFHLEPLGVPLFGDWRSDALTTLHQQYARLFSPEFAQCHRLLGERVQHIQPFIWSSNKEPSDVVLLDKPDAIAILRIILSSDRLSRPLEELLEPLKDIGSSVRYGHQTVIADMAGVLRQLNFRFENDM